MWPGKGLAHMTQALDKILIKFFSPAGHSRLRLLYPTADIKIKTKNKQAEQRRRQEKLPKNLTLVPREKKAQPFQHETISLR